MAEEAQYINDANAQMSSWLKTVQSKVAVKRVPVEDFELREIPKVSKKRGPNKGEVKFVLELDETGKPIIEYTVVPIVKYIEVPRPFKEIHLDDLALGALSPTDRKYLMKLGAGILGIIDYHDRFNADVLSDVNFFVDLHNHILNTTRPVHMATARLIKTNLNITDSELKQWSKELEPAQQEKGLWAKLKGIFGKKKTQEQQPMQGGY